MHTETPLGWSDLSIMLAYPHVAVVLEPEKSGFIAQHPHLPAPGDRG